VRQDVSDALPRGNLSNWRDASIGSSIECVGLGTRAGFARTEGNDRMDRKAWFFAFGLVVSAFGCSSSTVVEGSTGGATSSDPCVDLAKASCAERDTCTNGVANLVRYGDVGTCEARSQLSCAHVLTAPNTGATNATVEACAASYATETCADWLSGAATMACLPQAGSVANGKACAFNSQCASTYCATGRDVACGVCAELPKVGDDCSATGECANRGLQCVSGTQKCAAPVAKDGACDSDNPCASGLSCVGSKQGQNPTKGACLLAGTMVGAACDPKRQTAARCENALGLVCDGTTNKCVAAAMAAAGEPCGNVSGVRTACKAGGQCVLPAGMSGAQAEGTCVAPAADGAACDTNAGPPCLSPAKCVVSADGGTLGTCAVADPSKCL